IVERGFRYALKQTPVGAPIEVVESLHEHLDRFPDLTTELIGNLLLIVGALGQHAGESAIRRNSEKSAPPKQRSEHAQRDGLAHPDLGVPGRISGSFVPLSVDEHPMLAVGHQPERDPGAVEHFHHAGGRSGLPMLSDDRTIEGLARWISGYQ